MRTIHIHQAEIIEFEERESNYIAAIESQTIEAGLQTYIILMDPEEEVKLVIGSILTKEYPVADMVGNLQIYRFLILEFHKHGF